MAIVRCPDCKAGMLNTPRITVQRDKKVSEALPFKVCRRCRIVILGEKAKVSKWRFWDGLDYFDFRP